MIGINGMGRIGRTFFRVLHQNGKLKSLAAINDIMPKEHLIYLLQFDTVRGKFPVKIQSTERGISVDDHEILVYDKSEPKEIPWAESEVSIAVESTGVFTKKESLQGHIAAGAKKAILTTTGGEHVPLYILGVNHSDYKNEEVFSIGSCTVNGTAPLVKALADFKPQSIYLNVIHAYSARQNILDSYYPEIRRSRASADNIIPLDINLDLSLERLFPVMKDKIKSITSRVPIPCGVLTDLTMTLDNPPASSEELMEHLKQVADTDLNGIMDITADPIVSSDVLHDSHSLIIDSGFSHIMNGHAKLMLWFDNEWGFSNRLREWTERLM
ncbi:type I glyceraldehyde-3-phosphate dehydrogenase [Fulvivirga aurantia]|uniref:type I glyceraldehyde-3-phosphate dehydrogenase n=1 Tax=Fulvivirga aurantia TaxID=2529383 RepID=UPI001625F320|nr:glyceraldehyde 3-phosphate dehydrogenase NAD-binding domain-containing protein [Fulvivirga aurantia]